MQRAASLILLLWVGTSVAEPLIDPALSAIATPAQIVGLEQMAEQFFRKKPFQIDYESCWYAPQCTEAARVTFERVKITEHNFESYWAIFFPSWLKQQHPITPKDMQVQLGDWLTHKSVITVNEYRIDLVDSVQFVAFRDDVSYEEVNALMKAIEDGTCKIAPEFERIAAVFEAKAPGVLTGLKAGQIRTASRKLSHNQQSLDINAFSPEDGETGWDFTFREGVCQLLQFSPIYH